MTLNDVLTKQNLITKIFLANDGKELPKELKVKIMRIRMSYNKIKKQFDEDTQEFSKQIVSDELRDLANKTENDMMKVKNLGKKSLDEVIAKLRDLGLDLKKDEE